MAALAGCLAEKTRQCANGATCPFDEKCTEIMPITPGATLCGTPRLVDACEGLAEFTPCDFASQGSQNGTCRDKACEENEAA